MAIQSDDTILKKEDLKAYHNKILPYLGGNIVASTNNSEYYTTDEKVVGVWTDGKPLYQKVIVGTLPTTVGSYGDAPIDVSTLNIETIANFKGATTSATDNYQFPLVFTTGSNSVSTASVCYDTNNGVLHLRNNFSTWNGGSMRIILQYTKTTDTANSAIATPGAYDINFPNTWPANTEVYFGNGVYGYRATGTTPSSSTRVNYLIVQNVTNILSTGGCVTNTSGYRVKSGAFVDTTNYFGDVYWAGDNKYFYTVYSSDYRNCPYDVWFTYTK